MQFADLKDSDFPAQPAPQFTRMPDGSLVMVGNRQPMQRPGMLDRLRAAASQFIPAGLTSRAAEPSVPWWIAQPQSAPVAAAPPTAAAPSAPGQQDWDAISREAAHEEALAAQLGDVSKRILASPQLVEGKWFR